MWSSKGKDVAEYIRQCFHCVDSVAEVSKPHQLREEVHGTGVVTVIIHVGILHVGTAGLLGSGQAGVAANKPKSFT